MILVSRLLALVATPLGKWAAAAALAAGLLLLGKCAWDGRYRAGQEAGRQDVIQRQKERELDAIRKGSDARRDANSGSERDRRLRDEFRRD